MFKAQKGRLVMTNYTTGNWTVSDLVTDSILTPKNVSVPDLDYDSDYAKTMDEPDEARISNITSPDLSVHETIRFARSKVTNVYQNVDLVDASNVSPNKTGVQVMIELTVIYRAINSVTGEERDIPTKGRIVLRIPSVSYVTDAIIMDLFVRTVGAATKTGSTDQTRLVELVRGSLLPDGI